MRQNEFESVKRTSRLHALNIGLVFDQILAITAVALFNQIRCPFGYCFPKAIEKLSETLVATDRIGKFLKSIRDAAQKRTSSSASASVKGNIFMRNAHFSWNAQAPCLSSLNIHIPAGVFVGVCGSVASGKSSFLASILGEMYLIDGEMHLDKTTRFSYAPQTPWICADTIQANILFGKSLDRQRYETIIRACCLDVDLKVLGWGESGDLTMIGERGVNLSGGQRARVSLARALYAEADVYLFDDPLSAVDRLVAKEIYERCLSPRGLLGHKTRLLVTHHREHLVECDQTIVLVNGQIAAQGVFDQLSLHHLNIDVADQQSKDDQGEGEGEETSVLPSMLDAKSIVVEERSACGTVQWSVWSYLFTNTSLGWCGFYVLLLMMIGSEVLFDGTNYWLAVWLRHSKSSSDDDEEERGRDLDLFI